MNRGARRAATHKEEMPDRTVSNAKDRENIQYKLGMCIEPLNSGNNPQGIMTGRIAPDAVNIANYVDTGKEPMKPFETSWPKIKVSLTCQLAIYYTMPHSLLQCAMDVQVVKLCIQPDTSCGLARHHKVKQRCTKT